MALAVLSITRGRLGACRDELRAFFLTANLKDGYAAVQLLAGGALRGGNDWSLDGADPVVVAEQIAAYLAERSGESGLEATISLHRRGRVISLRR